MVSIAWTNPLRLVLLAVLLTVVGCQTAPVQEMSDARQAIAVAKEAGAAQYAATDLKAAEEHLSSAETNLDMRHYSQARDEAIQAKSRALVALKTSEESQDTDDD
jgi:hypothetical protein